MYMHKQCIPGHSLGCVAWVRGYSFKSIATIVYTWSVCHNLPLVLIESLTERTNGTVETAEKQSKHGAGYMQC